VATMTPSFNEISLIRKTSASEEPAADSLHFSAWARLIFAAIGQNSAGSVHNNLTET